MTPKELLETVINPALEILPIKMNSNPAKAMLIAIALQESGDLNTRVQKVKFNNKIVNGPAHGLWQFEKNGGVKGVINHISTSKIAIDICNKLNIKVVDKDIIWNELIKNDILACCFARLLLWTIPGKLPNKDNPDLGWYQYSKLSWNPGKPHPEKWNKNFNIGWETLEND